MRDRTISDSGKKSLRLVVLFLLVVCFFILVSLGIKIVSLVNTSVFDGSHRFVLFVEDKDKQGLLISLEPAGEMLMLSIKGKYPTNALAAWLSVPIDGTILMQKKVEEDASVSDILGSALFDPRTKYTSLNMYDLFKLYLISLKTSVRDTQVSSISLKKEEPLGDEIKKYFVDKGVVADNQTLAIENGAGESGLGQKFERTVSLVGGSVVSVTTARSIQQPTYIYYTGKKSYTVRKLERILRQKAEEGDTKVADILVVIGKRSLSLPLFATL